MEKFRFTYILILLFVSCALTSCGSGGSESAKETPAPEDINNFKPLVAEDFSEEIIGDNYSNGRWAPDSCTIDDSRSFSSNKSLKINTRSGQPYPACGGNSYYGGRQSFPEKITEGHTVWYRVKIFFPSTFSWGYLYTNSDEDINEANSCGLTKSDNDGSVLFKLLRLSDSTGGLGRIYLQASTAKRQTDQPDNGIQVRIVSEVSQKPLDLEGEDAAIPLDQWVDLQIAVRVQNDETGWLRYWRDGVFMGEVTDIKTERLIDEWAIGTHFNGVHYTDGAPGRSDFWIDEVIVASDLDGYGAPCWKDDGGRSYISPAVKVSELK